MKKPFDPFRAAVMSALALQLLLPAPVSATRLIPFQGRVTDGNGQPLAAGVYRVTFVIYDDAVAGTSSGCSSVQNPNCLYIESHPSVSIIGGQINVLLGSLVSLDDPNADGNEGDAVHFDEGVTRYLGITVGADTNQEMVPRHQLVPSFHARVADTTVAGAVDTEQLANGAVTMDKVANDILSVLVPPGSIMAYGGETAPPGWVFCDGVSYDGAQPQFADLFDAIGHNFGGSGNTFQVPDLRGQFLRGRDGGRGADPDAANRLRPNGTVGGGDNVGSIQAPATIPLQGAGTTATAGSHTHSSRGLRVFWVGGDREVRSHGRNATDTNADPWDWGTEPAGAHTHTFNVNVTPAQPINQSTEVRPRNVAVNYIIKL